MTSSAVSKKDTRFAPSPANNQQVNTLACVNIIKARYRKLRAAKYCACAGKTIIQAAVTFALILISFA
jgi:hypothetical protein